MANNNFFSQTALEKLRSPEKLDTMIRVTNPIGWMGLSALLVLFFAVVLWSFFGSYTEKADGVGIILDSAGISNITHTDSGKITKIYINQGDIVRKGDVVAHMEHTEELSDMHMAQYSLELAQSRPDALGRVYQFDAKQNRQNMMENVISDYDGIIEEIMVGEGSMVTAGSPIMSVRITQDRNDVKGVFFVPVDKGKRVEPGMTIQLAPNGVDTSEAGNLLAVVRSVSDYPISGQGAAKAVGIESLAQYMLTKEGGAVVKVRFDLVKDKSSESGYLWTNIIGKHKPITPGSFCTGSIVIDRKPPIEKVFYKFSQWLRSR